MKKLNLMKNKIMNNSNKIYHHSNSNYLNNRLNYNNNYNKMKFQALNLLVLSVETNLKITIHLDKIEK